MADTVVVTDVGMSVTTAALLAYGALEPHHIGWGTGTTAAAVGNTGLETPAAESRTIGTSSAVLTNVTGDTYQVVGTITCTGSGKAITEVVLMTDATAGSCYLRATFSAINVSVNDSIQFTIKGVYDQA